MIERDTIERARGGDPGAFRELYDANVDRIYRLTYRMCGEDDLARDFTQEAFFRAYQRLDQFRGDAAFSTWLHSIAVSVSLSRADPDLKERLTAAVDGLPDIYRTVFLMHDVEGYNHAEIAAALDVAEGTSKARLSRARSRLREMLSDFAPEVA